jgi:predicted dinucleotide-binding enzyme
MHIGIIGSGEVAQSLGEGLVKLGHDVMLGGLDSKDKELQAWKKRVGKKGEIGNTTEAASYAETAILAIAWHAAEDVLSLIRPELAGKIVVDVTNPLIFFDDAPPQLSVGHNISGGEIVQHSLPDSHVVKTLNYINHAHMVHPKFKEGKPVMFLCGNNQSAKNHTIELMTELGWEDIVDIGEIEKSRLLEPLSLLWIEYGVARDTWNHAIAFLQH